MLADYLWPGNVRELQNTIKRALGSSQFLQPEDVPSEFQEKSLTEANDVSFNARELGFKAEFIE